MLNSKFKQPKAMNHEINIDLFMFTLTKSWRIRYLGDYLKLILFFGEGPSLYPKNHSCYLILFASKYLKSHVLLLQSQNPQNHEGKSATNVKTWFMPKFALCFKHSLHLFCFRIWVTHDLSSTPKNHFLQVTSNSKFTTWMSQEVSKWLVNGL